MRERETDRNRQTDRQAGRQAEVETETDRDRRTEAETETDKQTDNERETDTVKSLILHSVLFFLSYVDGVFKYKYLSVTRICRRVKFLKRLDLDLKSP